MLRTMAGSAQETPFAMRIGLFRTYFFNPIDRCTLSLKSCLQDRCYHWAHT